jgi:proteasome accessory factor B
VLVHFPERRIATGARADLAEIYATIEAATRYRKRVTLTYQAAATGMTSRRDVDPYALVYRESAWLVVGWCHLRREVRMFRIDRIHEAVMAPRPKSPDFERPAEFDVKAYAQRSPWTFNVDPPEEIQLALAPEAAEVGNEDLGLTAVKRIDGDRTLVTFDCSNLEFAATRILAAKGAIRLLRGHRLRARIHDELDAIEAHYPVLDNEHDASSDNDALHRASHNGHNGHSAAIDAGAPDAAAPADAALPGGPGGPGSSGGDDA